MIRPSQPHGPVARWIPSPVTVAGAAALGSRTLSHSLFTCLNGQAPALDDTSAKPRAKSSMCPLSPGLRNPAPRARRRVLHPTPDPKATRQRDERSRQADGNAGCTSRAALSPPQRASHVKWPERSTSCMDSSVGPGMASRSAAGAACVCRYVSNDLVTQAHAPQSQVDDRQDSCPRQAA